MDKEPPPFTLKAVMKSVQNRSRVLIHFIPDIKKPAKAGFFISGGERGITPGILPFALRAALKRVQNRSRRFCRTLLSGSHPLYSGYKKTGKSRFLYIWRRERDSNPRYAINVYTLSRRAPSATQPSLQIVSSKHIIINTSLMIVTQSRRSVEPLCF